MEEVIGKKQTWLLLLPYDDGLGKKKRLLSLFHISLPDHMHALPRLGGLDTRLTLENCDYSFWKFLNCFTIDYWVFRNHPKVPQHSQEEPSTSCFSPSITTLNLIAFLKQRLRTYREFTSQNMKAWRLPSSQTSQGLNIYGGKDKTRCNISSQRETLYVLQRHSSRKYSQGCTAAQWLLDRYNFFNCRTH